MRFRHRNKLFSAFVFAAPLVGLLSPAHAQAWSPDGQKLVLPGSPLIQVDAGALVSERGTNGPLPGTALGAGIPGAAGGRWPAWSPDGKLLAYLADDGKLTIYNMTERQSIAPDPAAVSPITWSPDSSFLAYVRTDEKGSLELRTLHANGDQALAVTLPFTKLAAGTMNAIAWVPKTDNVIISGGDGTKTDLYLIDQGQAVALTTTGDVLAFAVSPDGDRVRWIMKSRNTHYILFSLYDLEIGKRTLSKVPFPDRLSAVNPKPSRSADLVVSAALSPDLEQIAFVVRGGPSLGQTEAGLFVSDVAGKRVTLVAKGQIQSDLPAKPAATPPAVGDPPPAPPALPLPVGTPAARIQNETAAASPFMLPVFSPDSRQLAFIRTVGERRYLSVFRLDTNQRRIGLLP